MMDVMTAEKMKLIAQYWPLARGNWRALYTKTARDIVVKLKDVSIVWFWLPN